jgi:type IV pilus assembly protein PilE
MDLTIASERQHGVTLIELLMALVIVAVLAAVAIPSYRSHQIRARRSEATAALLQLQAAQAKFYLQNNRYTAAIAAPLPNGLGLTGHSEYGLYDITVALDTNPAQSSDQSYTATATPAVTAGQSSDKQCTSFTLTDTGRRGSTGSAGTDSCWR